MQDLTVTAGKHDFSKVHAALRRHVDADLVAGVSSAVLVGRDLVDLHCTGRADREADVAMRTDHLFRAFSNTKLVTSAAVLLLWEEGRFALDDPIEKFIPQLGNRTVRKPGATSITDTEPARGPITIRQLMSHSSGLSYGLLDPGSVMFKAYNARGVINPLSNLAQMMDILADLPLAFHPGSGWEYSVATDVLSRLVEVVSGQAFDAFIRARASSRPLAWSTPASWCPPTSAIAWLRITRGADPFNPMKGGLTTAPQLW